MTTVSSKSNPPPKPSSGFRQIETPAKPQTLADGTASSRTRFRADMPTIPGVAVPAPEDQELKPTNWPRAAAAIGALLVLGSIGAWMMLRTTHSSSSEATQVLQPTPAPAELPAAPASRNGSTNEIGTVEELSAAWTAKKFTYSRPLTREQVPAIAIRLPSGSGRTAASYWVIILKAPFGQCALEYVSDVKQIASRFGFTTSHPMIADPCSNALYDPTRMGTLPNGSWARGEIVQGAGFRPPMQIEIRLDGDKLIAVRAED
jgi:hypothetical protein